VLAATSVCALDTRRVVRSGIIGQGARLAQRRFAARVRSESEGIGLGEAQVRQLDRFLEDGLDSV
jgi:delta1-piperideine-2-carboxylate reductase